MKNIRLKRNQLYRDRNGNIKQIPESMIYKRPRTLKRFWSWIKDLYYTINGIYFLEKKIAYQHITQCYYLKFEKGGHTWTRNPYDASRGRFILVYLMVKALIKNNRFEYTSYSLITCEDAILVYNISNSVPDEEKELNQDKSYFKW